MAKEKKVKTKTVAKKKTITKRQPKKIVNFNKFSVYFQALAVVLSIAALTLNICDCIDISIMFDLFGLAIIFLAFSLFPKRQG